MSSPSGKKSKGLCSGYLQGLQAGETSCRVFVRASTFKLPSVLSTPIVLIGPGTGVAPMRGLLQERSHLKAKGNNTLYFGCKNKDVDYLYREEMEDHVSSQVLSTLHLAFSREQQQKVYVQHLIKNPKNGQSLGESLWL
jgi:NADPH-ferrihemoprotein reductase